MCITSDVVMSNAIMEWDKWEEKLLVYGEVEAKSSRALQKKLLGEYGYNILSLLY